MNLEKKMMCYRDMTFCTFYKNCADAKDCHRPLTPEVEKAADEWFKSWRKGDDDQGAPICMFSEKPECWKEK